ncbi:sensor histidine kinase [Halobacillus shinanisalinarum]|uniref:histidine kinase n=1 Tax=Halobacillus shinanisalinarum TaxID=2932258 RepID=A0ABY4GXH7_9BACI|nr:sensor histidine kinase [Halobacillus shinanisalinarum]UOQ92628.1 sensor histidine kinase [Halobacillus shinanisalinarum]
MKLFILDKLPLILFYYVMTSLFMLVLKLATMNVNSPLPNENIFYLFILATLGLAAFLGWQYRRQRQFYKLDSSKDDSLEDLSWLPEPCDHRSTLLITRYYTQHHSYQNRLEREDKKRQQHIDFVQQWVHQMKTPLSVIKLALNQEKDAVSTEFYRSMEEEYEKLQLGLDLALYQARIDRFDRDFLVEKVTVRELAQTTIQDFKSSFIRNRVYPVIEIDNETIVETDEKWMRFVFQQLTANAIKYSSDTKKQMTYAARRVEGTVEFTLADPGVGIPKQDLTRVFDPFFTGENGRHFHESTGMGLYLSKEICDQMGHDLTIESIEGEGTIVHIVF